MAVYADGGSTPIGTAVAFGDTVDVTTTVPLADGAHTFTVEQFVSMPTRRWATAPSPRATCTALLPRAP